MNEQIIGNLAKIEYALCSEYTPLFLEVAYEENDPNFIHVVICRDYREYEPIHARVREVFTLIQEKFPDIINECTIVVEPFSIEEMESLLEHLF